MGMLQGPKSSRRLAGTPWVWRYTILLKRRLTAEIARGRGRLPIADPADLYRTDPPVASRKAS